MALEIGQGDIDVDRIDLLPFAPVGNADDNVLAFSVGGGYQFPSGAYVDLNVTDLDTVNLFGFTDAFGLSAIKLGTGYKFRADESFSFLAKIGVSFWELDVSEGFFLNPGPESGRDFHGTDFFFEVGGEFRFNGAFALTLIHSRDTYDLGDSTATRIGVKYFFGGL